MRKLDVVHKQIGDYPTRCAPRIAAAISLDDESSVTRFLEVMHSIPEGYASVPGDYAKILEVLLKFLEVMVPRGGVTFGNWRLCVFFIKQG